MDKLFWLLVIAALGILLFASKSLLPLVFVLIFASLVILWFRLFEINKKFRDKDVASTIQNIQKEVNKTEINLGSGDNPGNAGLDESRMRAIIAEEISGVKEQLNGVLDRFAKKLIDVENSLAKLRKTFAAGLGSLDDRVRAMEEEKFKDEQN